MMNGVGVIPKNSKISCPGLHVRQTLDDVGRIDHPGRIAVFGNAPDTFDIRIPGNQILNRVHCRAVFLHFDWNHFDAKIFANKKMTVVSGAGAQKLNLRKLSPGRSTVGHSFYRGAQNRVMHHIEA